MEATNRRISYLFYRRLLDHSHGRKNAMGGDGGTLNNSRHEHTQLRRRIFNTSAEEVRDKNRQRASVTHCAVSNEALQMPHVVVDKLGQFYNKEALIMHVLRRGRGDMKADENAEKGDMFKHIRSLNKDTRRVNTDMQDGRFVCPVTRKTALTGAGFTIGWGCGCVTAVVDSGLIDGDNVAEDGNVSICGACCGKGERIPLGMTVMERNRIRREVDRSREGKKLKKKKGAKVLKRGRGEEWQNTADERGRVAKMARAMEQSGE